jgi:hypothetical protein
LESLELTVRQALSVENHDVISPRVLSKCKTIAIYWNVRNNMFKRDIAALSTEIPDSTIGSDESGQSTMYHPVGYYMGLLQRIVKTGREVRDGFGYVESPLRSKWVQHTCTEDEEMRDEDLPKNWIYSTGWGPEVQNRHAII